MSSGAINGQTPYKRQRVTYPVVTKYPVPPSQTTHGLFKPQLHDPRRSLTHPPFTRNLQQNVSPSNVRLMNLHQAGPGPQRGWPPSPVPLPHDQQWNLHGAANPSFAGSSRRTNFVSSASSGAQFPAFSTQPIVQQHSPTAITSAGHGSFGKSSYGSNRETFAETQTSFLPSQCRQNQVAGTATADVDFPEEQAEESWWEELKILDYSEGLHDSRYIGKFFTPVV